MEVKTILKELKQISKQNLYNGEVQLFPDESHPFDIHVTITPTEGPYVGGRFNFFIGLPPDYPNSRPKVVAEQKIYHPNIDYESDFVCMTMFSLDWRPEYRLEHYLNGLLFLMKSPNFEDPANHEVDKKNFKNKLKQSLRGISVDGMKFSCCLIIEERAVIESELDEKEATAVWKQTLDEKEDKGKQFPTQLQSAGASQSPATSPLTRSPASKTILQLFSFCSFLSFSPLPLPVPLLSSASSSVPSSARPSRRTQSS